MATKRIDKGAERANAILTALLLAAVVVLGNRLAFRHLAWRRDFSEDQLYALSDATRSILGRLEDRLAVKAYFTGAVESGQVSLARARVDAQLEELAGIGGARIEVTRLDPSTSTAAASEAWSHGIRPRTVLSQQGTQRVSQPVYLGMVLRYRGREQVLDFVEPHGFEVQFASAVYALIRDRRPRVGWYEPGLPDTSELAPYRASFETVRNLLERRADVVDVTILRTGDPKDLLDDLDILIVLRPEEEHPRSAFEIDQFVQRGGRLVVLVDQADYDYLLGERRGARAGEPVLPTGLEELLRTWGANPTPHHVWDTLWGADYSWYKLVRDPASNEVGVRQEPGTSPVLLRLESEGFDPSHPVTAGLQGASLAWAQPIAPREPPPGVTRVDLLRASDDAYRVEIVDVHVTSPERIADKTESLLGLGEKEYSYTLAASLSGRFPSPFERAPAEYDPFLDDSPDAELRFTDEPVRSGEVSSHVIVFGDADWLRDQDSHELYPFWKAPGNQQLFMNVMDWLTLDEDLIALRRRVPKERRLRDFLLEAEEELGVRFATPPDTDAEARLQEERRDTARRRANRARWWSMTIPILATLALTLGFGLVWNLVQRGGRRS